MSKRELFKCAKSVIGCAAFPEGVWVAVSYTGQGQGGVHYFKAELNGKSAVYPEHHLTNFVL